MPANDEQVGGDHYGGETQHWDWVWDNHLDYFQGQITKYVMRFKKKNGLQDLKKAQHFLSKYIELVEVAERNMCTCARTPEGTHYEGCALRKYWEGGITLDDCVPTEKLCTCDHVVSGCDVHERNCPQNPRFTHVGKEPDEGEAPSSSYVNQDRD